MLVRLRCVECLKSRAVFGFGACFLDLGVFDRVEASRFFLAALLFSPSSLFLFT